MRRYRYRNTRIRCARGLAALLALTVLGAGTSRGADTPPTAATIAAKFAILERFLGAWDVTITTKQPKPSVVTYTETYEWVLQNKFLRVDSGRKSDGTQDIAFATYDPVADGYPFWIFSSSGAWINLPPASWDAANRSMTWKNQPNSSTSYTSRCIFTDDDTRQCRSLVKDWKGTVLLDQEVTARRRR